MTRHHITQEGATKRGVFGAGDAKEVVYFVFYVPSS